MTLVEGGGAQNKEKATGRKYTCKFPQYISFVADVYILTGSVFIYSCAGVGTAERFSAMPTTESCKLLLVFFASALLYAEIYLD